MTQSVSLPGFLQPSLPHHASLCKGACHPQHPSAFPVGASVAGSGRSAGARGLVSSTARSRGARAGGGEGRARSPRRGGWKAPVGARWLIRRAKGRWSGSAGPLAAPDGGAAVAGAERLGDGAAVLCVQRGAAQGTPAGARAEGVQEADEAVDHRAGGTVPPACAPGARAGGGGEGGGCAPHHVTPSLRVTPHQSRGCGAD
eukprot:1076337-Prorocentrum_minimum.AAC.1